VDNVDNHLPEHSTVQKILKKRISLRQYAELPIKLEDKEAIIEAAIAGTDRGKYDDVFDDHCL